MKAGRDQVAVITGAGPDPAAGRTGGALVSQHPVEISRRDRLHAAQLEAVAGHAQLDPVTNIRRALDLAEPERERAQAAFSRMMFGDHSEKPT